MDIDAILVLMVIVNSVRESMEVIRTLSLIVRYPPLSTDKQKTSTYSSS